jgi:DNA-directed RNA polymerase alpha subunit
MSEQNFSKQFEQQYPLHISIDDVEISLRLHQLLRSNNITTLGDIISKGKNFFENIPIFNTSMKRELDAILLEKKLEFKK